METIIANIRYSDEQSELVPLFENGIIYVKRHGDNSTRFYELSYDFGYVRLENELPDSFFMEKKLSILIQNIIKNKKSIGWNYQLHLLYRSNKLKQTKL